MQYTLIYRNKWAIFDDQCGNNTMKGNIIATRDQGEGCVEISYELELGPFFLPKDSTTFTNLKQNKLTIKDKNLIFHI